MTSVYCRPTVWCRFNRLCWLIFFFVRTCLCACHQLRRVNGNYAAALTWNAANVFYFPSHSLTLQSTRQSAFLFFWRLRRLQCRSVCWDVIMMKRSRASNKMLLLLMMMTMVMTTVLDAVAYHRVTDDMSCVIVLSSEMSLARTLTL